MRKQSKIIIWPIYFDAGKTRMEGRRVAKNMAFVAPKLAELEAAALKLNMQPETIPEKGYPKTPWNKMGMLLVEKQGSKEQTLNKLARQLLKMRNETPRQ
jgi:signal recognition particle subunit SRP19